MKKIYSIVLLLVLSITAGYSQTTYLSTPLIAGNGSGGCTFNLSTTQNVFILDVKETFTSAGTAEIWYNPTAINGAPTISTASGWILLTTGSVTASGAGMAGSVAPTNLFIPAGSTYGFYVGGPSGGPSVSYTNGVVGTATTVTDGTITIHTGTSVGYGGNRPNPTFHVRMFNGSVGYRVAAGGANDAATTDVFSNIGCPGVDTVFAEVSNYGLNQIDSVWVNWSKNGVLQTPVQYIGLLDTFGGTGANSANVSLGANTFTAGVTDTFLVWTSMPNGVVDTVTNNDTNSAYLQPSMSGVFTIGGTSPDYTTFTAAVADLNTIGLCGPVVFNVRQGTYLEQIDLANISGSSSTNTVTFQHDKSNTAPVILTYGATATANNYVVKFSGAEYVIFDSLTITATGSTYGYGFNFVNASHVTIKSCRINASATSTSSLSVPVYNQSGTANITEYTTIENSKLSNGYYGMYWYGGSTAAKEMGNSILNNEITNYTIYGLMCYYQGGNRVEGNTIEQSTSATSTSYGMYIYYNDSASVKGNKVTLYGSGTNYGMYINYNYGSATKHAEFYNNMIVTSATSTGTTYGMYMGYGKYIKAYHNSIHVRGGSVTGGRGIYVNGNTSTAYGNVDIRNNIFVNSGPGQAMYILTGATTGYLTNLDHNIYQTSGTNLISLSGTNHTLASFVTATALDSNSINGMPGFLSSTDLHLQGSIAFDNGDTTLGLLTDIDGQTRPMAPTTGFDIGADEYIPPTCPSGYGITNFNIAGTTIDITWIPGPSDTGWIIEYGAPGFAVGTGAGTTISSSNDTVSLSGLSALTNYDIYVRGICGVGDTSIWYSSTFKTGCLSMMSGTYTINSALPTGGTNYASFTDAAAALNACGISASVILNVKQGTYTEQIELNGILGTSATKTVTFQPDASNTAPVILTYAASGSADNYVVKFDGTERVTLCLSVPL